MEAVSNKFQARTNAIRRIFVLTLAANWSVAVAKLVLGVAYSLASVTADGLHSLIDGGSNVIGLIALSIASQPADEDHPYGHGKFEALASLGIGVMVGVGMLELGRMGIGALLQNRHPEVEGPMVAVMLVTLAVNLAITRLEQRAGTRLRSPLLLADARHTFSDVLVTLSVLASLALVKLGFPRADGVACLVILVFVARVAYQIVKQAVGILADEVRLDPGQVTRVLSDVDGVVLCKDVRSRGMEGSVYVDLKIEVDPSLPTARAHALAHEVERKLTEAFPQVADVVVHVEPEGTRP